MIKTVFYTLNTCLLVLCFIKCNSNTSAENLNGADTVAITKGQNLFNQHCSGCHNFRQETIGPPLSGITKRASVTWLQNFIRNPQEIIGAGDKQADSLYNHYKTIMPSFETLSNDEVNNIIAFLNTHNEEKFTDTTKGLTDPIPEKIKLSDLVARLQFVTQIPVSADSNKMPMARINKLDYQPAANKLFVVDLRGKLYELENNKATVYMDMAKLKPDFINQPGLATGFGSFAFHPQFAKNGLLYTTHTEKANSATADFGYADSIPVTLQWVLTEWKAADPCAKIFKGTNRELFRTDMVAGIHGVQEICFNPYAKQEAEDYGLLYIGIGDGGCAENGYAFLTHNPKTIWGTVLRINPSGNNSANRKYGIPITNPFAKNKNGLGEIYAYGFRNPHRITWTSTSDILVCNIGHGNIESIDLVKKGNDYGWPVREGRFAINPYGDLNKVHPLPANDSSYHITYPVAEYDHDEGKAICGGYEYTGRAIPQLKGKFLFGDIPTGRLFYTDLKDIRQGSEAPVKEWSISVNGSIKKLSELCGDNRVDLHFGKDAQGELYILTKADGKIYKVVGAYLK